MDTHSEDHPFDGIMAFLMSRPQPADGWVDPSERDVHPGLTSRGERKTPAWEKRYRELTEPKPDNFQMPRTFEPSDGWL